MKLNNKGWGLKQMLVLSGILIFFFCIAIYFIYVLYNSLAEELAIKKESFNYIEKI